MAERNFERGEKKRYSHEEKHELDKLALHYKAEYDAKKKEVMGEYADQR